MFLANNFPLSDAEDNTSGLLNRRVNSRFASVENTISNLPKALRAKFLASDALFCFMTSLSELYFRFQRFIILVQTKVISMNGGSSRRSGKPWRWVRLDLMVMMRDIYINSSLGLLSSWSSESKDILPWSISQMIPKFIPINTRIVQNYVMKQGILFQIWWKVMEIEATTGSEFPNSGKAIVEKILASEERKKSKRAGLW